MNIFRPSAFRALALSLAFPLSALLAGCDVGSADSTTAVIADNDGTIYNFAGLYMHPSTSGTNAVPLVYPNQEGGSRPSGRLITSMRLLQYGRTLEAFDSEGQTWSGSISALQSGTATFSLQGRTTAGQAVEVAGTLIYADQQSTMDATWIEPAYYGSLYARATVAPSTTNSPTGDVTLSANSSSASIGEVITLTAAGGTGSYSWPSSVAFGTFFASGGTATYTRTTGTSADSVSITVSSGGDAASVTLEFD